MPLGNPRFRAATRADLAAINTVIERAVGTWPLAERVKRLSLPLYRYSDHDFDALTIIVADVAGRSPPIVGVAAWEQAEPAELPPDSSGLLLHGLYVDPDFHGQGIGSRLLAAAEQAAQAAGADGLLVKAQPQAAEFFRAAGLHPLAITDPERDYPHRWWRRC